MAGALSAMLPGAPLAQHQSTPLWILSLLWLALLVALQSVLFWLNLPYDQTPDQDIVLAYNALVMNSGQPQEYFDHTGYTYFLLLAPWFKLLHATGFLSLDSLTALPPTADPAAFEIAWQQIVEAGRLLSMVIAAAFTVLFALLTARLFDDRRIGFIAGLAFATSLGVISQIGLLRTELLSSFFVVAATLLAAMAAAGKWTSVRFLLLGLAAFVGVLAVLAKVFALLPVAAVPLIAVAFGTTACTPEETKQVRRRRAVIVIAVAILTGIPAAMIVITGLTQADAAAYSYQPFAGGPLAFYQGIFALWILACVGAYAVIWKVPLEDALSAVGALVIGTSLGLAVLLIQYDLKNVVAATHPVEHMFVFATWSNPALGEQSTVLGGALFGRIAEGAWSLITTRVTNPTRDNLFWIELFVVASILVGVWAPGRRWIVQAGLLLSVSWAMQSVFLLRYDQRAYHIYSDPFTIMATAVAVARFRTLLLGRFGSVAVIGGLLVYAYWAVSAEAFWSSRSPRNPAEVCQTHHRYLKQIEPFPFCPEDS